MKLEPFRNVDVTELYYEYELSVPKHGVIKLTVERAFKDEALLKVESKDGKQVTIVTKIHPQSI